MPLPLEVRQKLSVGAVVMLADVTLTNPPEALWYLNEEPPWVWSPVQDPPGTYAGLVISKQGENIKVQRLCSDPDDDEIWLIDQMQKPTTLSAKMIWDVRAKVSELPPSGSDRRWKSVNE